MGRGAPELVMTQSKKLDGEGDLGLGFWRMDTAPVPDGEVQTVEGNPLRGRPGLGSQTHKGPPLTRTPTLSPWANCVCGSVPHL